MIYLAVYAGAVTLIAVILFYLMLIEYRLRLEAEKCWKYWKDKTEERSATSTKHYVGLRECYEEAQKLYAFIGQRYHGEA